MKRQKVIKVAAWSLILLTMSVAFFIFMYQPWQMNWGASDEEIDRAMPGDEIVKNPIFNATRGVSIEAAPEEIWPWIVQIGYKKAGFYSHDWLDNARIRSAERIIPEYQNLKVGDLIPLSKDSYARVAHLENDRSLLLVFHEDKAEISTWAWGLYKNEKGHTRLVTRLRIRQTNFFSRVFLDLFEIVMMRKCLLGIKRRAETLSGNR